MPEYELLPYDHEDLSELLEIYRESFGGSGSIEYFRWKYLDNPSGRAVSFVARHNGGIAAFYGLMPERFWVNGQEQVIYQSMDTMTHPLHRGHGLFIKLARATFEHVERNEGSIIAYGFPGPTSYGGFVNKLGWKLLTRMPYLFLNKWIFRGHSALRPTPELQISPISELDASWDDYFNDRTVDGSKVEIKLDRHFITWRTLRHPSIPFKHLMMRNKNRTVGLCIYRMEGNDRVFIQLLDIRTPEDHMKCTQAVMAYLFDQLGIDFIYTFQNGAPLLKKAFMRSGFLTNPLNKGPFSYRTPYIIFTGPRTDRTAWEPEDIVIQPLVRDY